MLFYPTLGSDSMGSGQFESDESRLRVGLELDTIVKSQGKKSLQGSIIKVSIVPKGYLAFEDSISQGLGAPKTRNYFN